MMAVEQQASFGLVNLTVFKCQTTGNILEVGVRTSGGADRKLSGLDRDTEKQSPMKRRLYRWANYNRCQLPKCKNR